MNGEAKYYRDCVKHFLGTVKGDEPLGARERYGPLDHPTAEEIAASAHAELARAGLEVKLVKADRLDRLLPLTGQGCLLLW